jgi:hypothetical protein
LLAFILLYLLAVIIIGTIFISICIARLLDISSS